MATLLFVLALLQSVSATGLNNSVALTPAMGINLYNMFSCDTTEAQYRNAVQALVKTGLKDLGYTYVNLDCGWQSNVRAEDGSITWNATRFPSGMPALAEYVHSLDLKFGIYSDSGLYSCDRAGGWAHWTGSRGNEDSDAKTFASWGADYLKYSACFTVNSTDFVDYNPPIQYEAYFGVMRDALNQTGRPIVYSIDAWGVQDPANWQVDIANSWRIAGDIGPSFADLRRIINEFVPISKFSTPGGWNDLDLLVVGSPGMTSAEWKTNFAFWALAKSPLLISTDLTSASDEVLSILSNKDLIAVNQDQLGHSISFRRRYANEYDVWAGPLSDGSTVVLILNWQDTCQTINFSLSDINLVSADFTDLWNGTVIGPVDGSHTATVEGHDTLVYKLTDVVAGPEYDFTTYYCDSSSNSMTGGVQLLPFDNSYPVAANIGYDGTFTFGAVDGGTKAGTKLLSLSYVNADYTFSNEGCPNCDQIQVSANGGTPLLLEMAISGMNGDTMFEGYMFKLDGFVPGPSNTLTFSNPNGWGPQIYSLSVASI